MNEKFPVPQAERIIGSDKLSNKGIERLSELSGRKKDEDSPIDIPTELQRVFKKSGEVIPRFEVKKTEKDRKIIMLAMESVKAFARELGKEEFTDLPIENIHYLQKGGVRRSLKKGSTAVGSHSTVLGKVSVDRGGDLQTAITTFHELWHALASYHAVQVSTKGVVEPYRSGFGMKSRDGKEEWFYSLDEGLTGFMTKRFVEEVLEKHPDFKDLIEEKRAAGKEIDTTRQTEMDRTRRVAEVVWEKNKESLKDPEAVMTMFLRAQVTGNVLPIARLMEKTFGKGFFRHVGENSQPKSS